LSWPRDHAMIEAENEPIEVRLAIARACVSDPDQNVRNSATECLADFGTSLDRFRIRQLLRDPSWVVRSTAVEAIEVVFGKSGEGLLIAMLQDPHRIVRRDAGMGLGFVGAKASIPHLKNRLRVEKQEQAKVGIYEGLFTLGERKFLKPLLGLGESEQRCIANLTWDVILRLADLGPFETEEVNWIKEAMYLSVLRFDCDVCYTVSTSVLKEQLARLIDKLEA